MSLKVLYYQSPEKYPNLLACHRQFYIINPLESLSIKKQCPHVFSLAQFRTSHCWPGAESKNDCEVGGSLLC